MTDTTSQPKRRTWRTFNGRLIFAHAIWEGSWFAATHDSRKPGRIIQHTVIKERAASREHMERILEAYARQHKWSEVQQ